MTTPKSKIVSGSRKKIMTKDGPRSWNANTLYEPEFLDVLIQLMKKGYSVFEVAAHLGVGVQTLNRWGEEFPDFGNALASGKDYRRAWLDKGFRGHMDEKFDMKGYTVALTADYGYNDKNTKVEVSVKDDDEATIKIREVIDDLHKTTI